MQVAELVCVCAKCEDQEGAPRRNMKPQGASGGRAAATEPCQLAQGKRRPPQQHRRDVPELGDDVAGWVAKRRPRRRTARRGVPPPPVAPVMVFALGRWRAAPAEGSSDLADRPAAGRPSSTTTPPSGRRGGGPGDLARATVRGQQWPVTALTRAPRGGRRLPSVARTSPTASRRAPEVDDDVAGLPVRRAPRRRETGSQPAGPQAAAAGSLGGRRRRWPRAGHARPADTPPCRPCRRPCRRVVAEAGAAEERDGLQASPPGRRRQRPVPWAAGGDAGRGRGTHARLTRRHAARAGDVVAGG